MASISDEENPLEQQDDDESCNILNPDDPEAPVDSEEEEVEEEAEEPRVAVVLDNTKKEESDTEEFSTDGSGAVPKSDEEEEDMSEEEEEEEEDKNGMAALRAQLPPFGVDYLSNHERITVLHMHQDAESLRTLLEQTVDKHYSMDSTIGMNEQDLLLELSAIQVLVQAQMDTVTHHSNTLEQDHSYTGCKNALLHVRGKLNALKQEVAKHKGYIEAIIQSKSNQEEDASNMEV